MTREHLLATLGSMILRLLFLTLRLEFEDRTGFTKNILKSPVIMCFWHNRILGISLAFLRHYPRKTRKGVNVLTSASRDGEILAQLVGQLGMEAVRDPARGADHGPARTDRSHRKRLGHRHHA
jgi:lysophospholipid acyltransferase (LPLAT)-like uncharacterized protein